MNLPGARAKLRWMAKAAGSRMIHALAPTRRRNVLTRNAMCAHATRCWPGCTPETATLLLGALITDRQDCRAVCCVDASTTS
eukprot:3548595-Pleurochrysis_carterae.AAC.2